LLSGNGIELWSLEEHFQPVSKRSIEIDLKIKGQPSIMCPYVRILNLYVIDAFCSALLPVDTCDKGGPFNVKFISIDYYGVLLDGSL
jgi:hypothetical protein